MCELVDLSALSGHQQAHPSILTGHKLFQSEKRRKETTELFGGSHRKTNRKVKETSRESFQKKNPNRMRFSIRIPCKLQATM